MIGIVPRLALAAAAILVSPVLHAQSWAWDDGSVPFVVSPDEVVDRMLRIAQVGPGDVLIDLGSGDGRIVIEAARRGARALGVDNDPSLVERAKARAAQAGVSERARFELRDLFETDLAAASVITMYLLPEFNLKLMPRLLALAPGTRIVSHDWDMGAWEPDETILLRTPEKTVGVDLRSRIFLWVVPADARGAWTSELPGLGGSWRFDIEQKFQALEVTARVAGREMVVRGSRLRGSELKLAISGSATGRPGNYVFRGTLRGDEISGEVLLSNGEEAKGIPWKAKRLR